MNRNGNIDFIKGILVILVILGHVIPGVLQETFSRYFIYSFHMPLFIAVSGYLVPTQKLNYQSRIDILHKYWYRLIVPWICAVNIYFIIKNFPDIAKLDLIAYVELYYKPYFHLWFTVAYLLYLYLFYLLNVKLNLKPFIIAILSLPICIIYKFYTPPFTNPFPAQIWWVINNLRPYYFIFFILGILIRNYGAKISDIAEKRLLFISGIMSMAFICMVIYNFFYPLQIFDAALYFFNVPFALFIIICCKRRVFPRSRLLEFIGCYSYPFYLWHMVGVLIAINIVKNDHSAFYYLICLFWNVLIGLLCKYAKNNRHINYCFIGTNNIAEFDRRQP